MNKIITVAFILLFFSKSYSADKHLLIFKPIENLKYKIQIQPAPESVILNKLFGAYSSNSIFKMSIKENDKNTYKVTSSLIIFNKSSCCNPLTYPGYFITTDREIENIISPTGEFIDNSNDYLSMGCIFGFNILKLNNKEKNIKPVIIPFYFPDKEISIGESWTCKFEFDDNVNANPLFIDYTIKKVSDNIAYIDGYSLDRLHITAQFNITKGCWTNYKMFVKKDSEEYLFKSFELIE